MSVRLASQLLDDAVWAAQRQLGVLLRTAAWLALPALAAAALFVALDPAASLSGGLSAEALLSAPPLELLPSLGRSSLLLAPVAGLFLLTGLCLGCMSTLAGWQLLHGRGATTRGLLLGLYGRRWSVLGAALLAVLCAGLAEASVLAPALALGGAALLTQSLSGGALGLGEATRALLLAPTTAVSFLFSLSMAAVMIEDASPAAALRRSVALLSRSWSLSVWAFVFASAVGWLITLNLYGVANATGLVGASLSGPLSVFVAPEAWVLSMIVSLCAVPARSLIFVALYRRLRAAEAEHGAPLGVEGLL